MHYGISLSPIISDWSGSGNVKSFGMRWNPSRHEPYDIMFLNSQAIQLGQWDTRISLKNPSHEHDHDYAACVMESV